MIVYRCVGRLYPGVTCEIFVSHKSEKAPRVLIRTNFGSGNLDYLRIRGQLLEITVPFLDENTARKVLAALNETKKEEIEILSPEKKPKPLNPEGKMLYFVHGTLDGSSVDEVFTSYEGPEIVIFERPASLQEGEEYSLVKSSFNCYAFAKRIDRGIAKKILAHVNGLQPKDIEILEINESLLW